MKEIKKIGVFLILLLALSLFSSLFISQCEAQELGESGLPADIEKVDEAGGKLTDSTKRSQYLKHEWTKILEKSKLGNVILSIGKIFQTMNPFFKAVLGMEYSLSWAFIFAVAIWLILFFIIHAIMSAVISKNKLLPIISAFVITSLIGLSGVIRKAVDLLTSMISKPWLAWISLGLAIVILVIIKVFGKSLKETVEKAKEKEAKEKEEEHRKTLEVSANIEEQKLESYLDGGAD
jgi:hypothetical protein